MPKAGAILEPAKKSDYKSPHLDTVDKRYPSDHDENTKMPDTKHITPKSDHFISTQSMSDIQST